MPHLHKLKPVFLAFCLVSISSFCYAQGQVSEQKPNDSTEHALKLNLKNLLDFNVTASDGKMSRIDNVGDSGSTWTGSGKGTSTATFTGTPNQGKTGTFKPTFSGEVTVDGKGGGGGGKPKTYDWTAKAKYTIIEIHRKVAGQGNFVKISDVNNVDPVVISQKIELKVVGAPAGSQFQWSVTGGDPIKDYKFNANNATLTKLVAADMKNDQISFYYTSAANANISVTVTPSGEQPISKSAGFTINRPTVNIFRAVWTTATPPVGLIKDPPNIISVGLGGYDNSTPPKPTEGITWEAQITPPNGGDGGIAFIQTLTAKNMMKQYKSSVSWTILEKNIDTGNTPVLDTMVPYQKATLAVKANTLSAMLRQGDSPGTELVNLMTEVNLSGNFSLYLVYYAAGTSIPVPLGKIDWNYKARATKTGGSNNGYNGWERAPNGCSKGGGNSVNWSTPPTWNDNLRR